ncbi:hypothetical protein [Roseovarius salinarum]|uniref:hypothetical protein n=1 Tax=Roseovarius salinarum TaxID=1981892 RepID=UPI000C34432F|nr:hypothetical protein [Roseovarius salinarum]
MSDIVRLAGALYEMEQARMHETLREEAALREDLGQLDAHWHDTTATAARAIGADVLWQGWVARRRAELNSRLAAVLAQKEKHIAALRAANGRKVAAERLAEQMERDAARDIRRRRAEEQQRLAVIRSWSDR